jgi:hypothetical protein
LTNSRSRHALVRPADWLSVSGAGQWRQSEAQTGRPKEIIYPRKKGSRSVTFVKDKHVTALSVHLLSDFLPCYVQLINHKCICAFNKNDTKCMINEMHINFTYLQVVIN